MRVLFAFANTFAIQSYLWLSAILVPPAQAQAALVVTRYTPQGAEKV